MKLAKLKIKMMTKKITSLTMTIAIITVFFISCDKQLNEPKTGHEESISVLGKKLENPYSLENMQKALNNLQANQKGVGETITTSHLYVKFKPHNDDDLSLLKQDTTLILYPYPLDYEIIEGATTYHDSNVPEGKPTFQYAAVRVKYNFPSVDYEVLEELYIPEEEAENRNLDDGFVNTLVDEALRITNNLSEEELNDPQTRSSKWRPAGTIKVWDDNFNTYIPIKHLKVKARRWFTTYTGITNSNGYYSCNGRFRRDANYSLQFERYDFEIRDAWLSTANINGPKKKGNWNLNMNGGKREFWATIFRATSHYYYDNIKGLRRPPQNSFWNTQLKLRAMYESNGNANGTHCAACRFMGLGSAIKIYNPQNDSKDIYATTIHEIAHASHWNMDQSNYSSGDKIVLESWARGVERELTRQIYSSYNPDYSRLRYTGVVHDMIDSYKTRNSSYYWTEDNAWVVSYKSYNDQVSGYTIRQIEDALYGEKYWNNWKNNIKNSYNNATENNLDASFSFWNTQ